MRAISRAIVVRETGEKWIQYLNQHNKELTRIIIQSDSKETNRRAVQKNTEWSEEILTAARSLQRLDKIMKVLLTSGTEDEINSTKQKQLEACRSFKAAKTKVWKRRDKHLQKMVEQHVATIKEKDLKGERDAKKVIKNMRALEK